MEELDEAKKKKLEEIKKSLNEVIGEKPYIATISILDEYSSKTDDDVNVKVWNIRHMGNLNIIKDPFPKVSALIRGILQQSNELAGVLFGEGEKR